MKHGILLINKPSGISSSHVVQTIKYLFDVKKVGHTGTLDPMATGLLPICLGDATGFSSYLLESDKEYIATIKLGISTATYDKEGAITATYDISHINKSQITQAIYTFLGDITQTPPIYSALKFNGQPLYKYALAGISVEIKTRNIQIHQLEILEFIDDDSIKLRILCSKGTYIRSLAHDLGVKLGIGAHLTALQRISTNHFTITNSYDLDYIRTLNKLQRMELLLPIDSIVNYLPLIHINDVQYIRIKHGNHVSIAIDNEYIPTNTNKYRMYYQQQFIGIALIDNNNIQPNRMIANLSINPTQYHHLK